MKSVGLVLEGGGMRGLYTCGVLDALLDAEVSFPYVVGVSAGACNAVSYLSGQKGRNLRVNTEFIEDWRYKSVRNMVREGSYFGMKFIFETIPDEIVPFDYKAFHQTQTKFVVGTTNCQTGEPVYFLNDAFLGGFDVLKASSSLPMLSPMVSIDSKLLLDGGVVDPIPIEKSIVDGNQKHVVVLTREASYRKSPQRFMGLVKMRYRGYPALVERMRVRHERYNSTLNTLEALEREGKVFIIRPSEPVVVDRLEKSQQKLVALYDMGKRDMERQIEALSAFLK